MALKRNYSLPVLIVSSLVFLFFSCSKTTGVLYKIFTVGYKSFVPLETKSEKIAENLLGGYIINNKERGMLIEKKDEQTYVIKFLTTSLNENNRKMEGFLSTVNNRKYLNLLAQDGNFIFVRIDSTQAGNEMKLITHRVSDFLGGLELKDWLKKDGEIPDTSSALFKIPLEKKNKDSVIAWSKNLLRPQVRDLDGYYRFEKLFPDDNELSQLKKLAVEKTVMRSRSVTDLYKIIQKYPDAAVKARERARGVCTNTKNCLDFISYFPEEGVRDSMLDNAFLYARNEEDFKTLMDKFPDHKKTPQVMTNLFYLERAKKYPSGEINEILERYKNNAAFLKQAETIRIFENLPFNEIEFNKFSYVLTKSTLNALDRFLFFISESNREKRRITDVYVVVNCNLLSEKDPDAAIINFKQSLNRAVSLKKFIQQNQPKGVDFHFIPCGSLPADDSLKDGSVKFLLSNESANDYKARFVKLCVLNRKYLVVPDFNREYNSDIYIREPELEDHICKILTEKLTENKNATLKIIPPNLWSEAYSKDFPEFEDARQEMLNCFLEKKLRKRKPADYVTDLK